MKPLDIGVTATLEGLDIDLRGSGPLELTETQKLARTAERLDLARVSNHGAVVIERRPPRVAFGEALVKLPPGGFLQATEAGEALARRIRRGGADGRENGSRISSAAPAPSRCASPAGAKCSPPTPTPPPLLRSTRAAATTPGFRKLAAATRDLFRRPLTRRRARAVRRARSSIRRARAREAQARAVGRERAAACRRHLLQCGDVRPRRAHSRRRRLSHRVGRRRLTSSAFPRMSKSPPSFAVRAQGRARRRILG